MKKQICGILLLGMLSCQKSEDSIVINETIQFNVAGISQQQKTRTGNDHIDILKNSENGFGVFVSSGELQASGNIAENHQIRWNGYSWYDSILWSPENASINVYAYYPIVLDPFDNINIKLPIIKGSIYSDQSSLEKLQASDFLVARKLDQTSNPINLIFEHLLVKLRFHINSNGNGIIENACYYSQYARYEYNFNTDTLTSSPEYSSLVEMYCYQTQTGAIAEAITSGSLLKAESDEDQPFFLVKTNKDGIPKQYRFNLTEDIPLKSKTIYNFYITLIDNEVAANTINVSNVAITKWTDSLIPNILIPSK